MTTGRAAHVSHADRLALVAAYWPSAVHSGGADGQPPQRRLPLAWVACSPSARTVAEQQHAWVVLPYTHAGGRRAGEGPYGAVENTFGAGLANATMQPRVLQVALGTGDAVSAQAPSRPAAGEAKRPRWSKRVLSWLGWTADSLADVDHAASLMKPVTPAVDGDGVMEAAEAARRCGVHLGGLTVVLVSGVHMLETTGVAPAVRPQRNATGADAAPAPPHLLFATTTSCGGTTSSVLAVPPNAAVYDAIATDGDGTPPTHSSSIFRKGAVLHGEDGGANNEASHDPKTAASVQVVQQFCALQQRLGWVTPHDTQAAANAASVDLLSTVWYRQVFVGTAAATDEVLCGVSQWWLQRPIRAGELPTANLLASLTAPASGGGGGSACTLPAPQLHVKYVADVFADLWWPHRIITVVQHRHAALAERAAQPMRGLVLVWVLLTVLVEAVLYGVPYATRQPRGGVEHPSRNRDPHGSHSAPATDSASLVSAFFKLGGAYGRDHVASLDVGRTGVRGTHLLAYVMGCVLADDATAAAAAPRARLRALDVAGCTQLRHRDGELHALADTLHQFGRRAATRLAATPPTAPASVLAVADVLLSLSWQDSASSRGRSAAGIALALLTHHGQLTWVCGAGSDMDSPALRELGEYALLAEALAATHQPQLRGQPYPRCTLRALDLTSALSVDNVNALGYLTQLEQLLLPFTYVDDVGIARLDGHACGQDLGAFLVLCNAADRGTATAQLQSSAQAALQNTVEALQQLVLSAEGNGVRGRTGYLATLQALHRRFCSHLYHLDLTYCLRVSSVRGLVMQERLELLNISQTRVNKAGLLSGTNGLPSPNTTAPATPSCRTPPLRLFMAEMCEHLSDLSGLAPIVTLECVIVRSGSLGDDGLRPMCTPNMRHLRLLNLSYCDRLHHIGCLTQLPALETLIIDNTDVTPAEVKLLRPIPSLRTLSLRCCTEFAVIGKGLPALESAIGTFAALQRYIYEDLAGDEELRKKSD
ncbi:hypothetical protein NESM_000710200 [Novymonas esmeraldas]|uniref:Uncharacterized protein n=1 Tax=Novymonas esmeraldas TaxID=1808958 RepID=A0AAW0EVK2_9TRYP